MTQPLFHKQQEALDMAVRRWREGRRGIMLAMDMGTGKSRTAIEFLKHVHAWLPSQGRSLVTLIACPMALLPDPRAKNPGGWEGEFRKWWPDPETYMDTRYTTARRVESLVGLCRQHAQGDPDYPLVIAQSYESWRQQPFQKLAKAVLNTKKFYTVFIMDESHRAKSPKASRTMGTNGSFCRHVAARASYTLALSGTPMPRGPEDLWSQFYCIDPELFGDNYYSFRSRWFITKAIPGTNAQMIVSMRPDVAPRFKGLYNAAAFTCKIDEVVDLPSLTERTIDVQLSDKERRAYDQMEKLFFTELKEESVDDTVTVSAANVLSKMMKLSQITGGVIIDLEGDPQAIETHPTKTRLLFDILEDIPPEEPVVIFTRFIADIENIKKYNGATGTGRTMYELSGRVKDTEKWRASNKGDILVVQEQAGGVGVDLTRARYAFFYSVNYSLGDFNQAMARIYRHGQTRHCEVFHLVASDTIDEAIRCSIASKGNVVNAVLGRGGLRSRIEFNPKEAMFDPFLGD